MKIGNEWLGESVLNRLQNYHFSTIKLLFIPLKKDVPLVGKVDKALECRDPEDRFKAKSPSWIVCWLIIEHPIKSTIYSLKRI